ncbi:MAG: chemotaxis protein CheA [Campylobacterota bacterium]|nr:chemotaxis protein CheA [Campylobacterota bacterium]
MDPLLEQFLVEARENLGFIDQNIEAIGGDDPELLNSVFRAAHTLKGGSGIVGFESVKDITHHAEDLLDMLRGGKIEFQPSMLEALYNAFDEVMNLVEAAEESEEIVDADEERLQAIVAQLSSEMGKDDAAEEHWSVPFTLINDVKNIVNMPLHFLKDFDQKITFKQDDFSENDCSSKHLFAITFDVDESCMVYGNDPIYTLSLLGDDMLGMHMCMSEQNAKSVLSGMDDPDGLLLQTQLTAFVYGIFSDIEDALFNFLDELQFSVLDIATLLSLDHGESNHQLDLIKELTSNLDLNHESIQSAIEKVLPLIGTESIQYSQLVRLSEISHNIEADDLNKLSGFFTSLEKGECYQYDENNTVVVNDAVTSESVAPTKEAVEVDENMQANLNEILTQQIKVLENTGNQNETLMRVAMILEKLRRFYPDMPQMSTQEEMLNWMCLTLGVTAPKISEAAIEETVPEVVVIEQTPVAKGVEESIVENVVEKVEEEKPSVVPALPKKESVKKDKAVATKAVVGKTVKIEQESIDNLMNIVGELLVAKNSLPYLADNVVDMNTEMIKREIMEKYTFINRLSEQLQDLIMSMRMLPISYVFDRYPKLVREISKNLGKKVKLNMEGGNTKLDKNMIEMLADPMIHIMRNSLDHGIETPDVRLKKGKSEEGTVSLEAYAQSDKIVIEIMDDGAGINVDRVIQKVLEKELLTIDQIEAMSDNEKAELVMLAGLSTADEISEYSGRGVGMDVVRKSIEGFGGTISIETRPNQGTTIRLSIPVSLAVSELLHVTMNGVHYGLPMDNVSEIVKIERSEIEYLHNEPFIYLRGEVIPLLFIKTMLDEEVLANHPLPIVVLNIKDNLVAVVVNELLGQLDVVQKPLEGVMETHPIFSGTALLGNGQIIMTIDPLGILGISNQLKSSVEKAM